MNVSVENTEGTCLDRGERGAEKGLGRPPQSAGARLAPEAAMHCCESHETLSVPEVHALIILKLL